MVGEVPSSAPGSVLPVDPEAMARSIVLRQLTMGSRSRAQLAEILARRGISHHIAGQVLDRMEEVGLVDDQAFAADWARSRHLHRGLSRRALANELKTRGIDAETVDGALTAIDDDAERLTAAQLVDRRLRSMAGVPPGRQLSRLAGMLARRGYRTALIHEVVSAAVSNPPPHDTLPVAD
ncbi:MAG: regulatory protein RecX [Angustibacter sp.]